LELAELAVAVTAVIVQLLLKAEQLIAAEAAEVLLIHQVLIKAVLVVQELLLFDTQIT
jgi:hypothetical protein